MEFCAAFEVCAALKAARTVAPRPKNKLAETRTSKPAPLTALMNPNEFLFVNNKCESSTVKLAMEIRQYPLWLSGLAGYARFESTIEFGEVNKAQ